MSGCIMGCLPAPVCGLFPVCPPLLMCVNKTVRTDPALRVGASPFVPTPTPTVYGLHLAKCDNQHTFIYVAALNLTCCTHSKYSNI